MRRIFKTRHFARWARKAKLTDAALRKAVEEMERGLIDADLGGGVVKKRVALPGRGKSGSTRTLLATNFDSRWFFTDGFEKKDKDNLDDDELKLIKEYAQLLLGHSDAQITRLIEAQKLEEIQ